MDDSRAFLVQVRDLTVTYSLANGEPVRALNNLSIDVREGEILGILGESGCGKSTLANSLLRLLPSSARIERGDILFRGCSLVDTNERDLRSIRGRQISLVSQDPALSLNPVLSVGTQIDEVLRAHLPMTSRMRKDCVHDLLRDVGFDRPSEVYAAYPHELSGGQRQRIVIARAVACRPALVIADEPTSKLDAVLRTEIVSLLDRLRALYGTTLIVISHDPTVIAALADRIAVLYAGSPVEIGKREEILRRPLHPYTQALVQIARSTLSPGKDKTRGFASIEGDFTATNVMGCDFEPRCPDRMRSCVNRRPPPVAAEPARLVNCFKYGE